MDRCAHSTDMDGQCDGEGCGSSHRYSGESGTMSITLVGRENTKEDVNGVYIETPQLSSDKPVYIKSTGDKYISLNAFKQWIITTEDGIGTNSGQWQCV